MTLLELQNVLGDQIESLTNKDVPLEDRIKQADVAKTVSSLAKQMINNADVVLRTEKLIAEGKLESSTIKKMVDHNE